MVRILILDDNKATSAFLKMTLTHHRYRVTRTSNIQKVTNHPAESTPELILINQAFRNHSGWEMFNHLKLTAPHIPAMAYGLDQLNAANADWIFKAVETVIGETENHTARHSDPSASSILFAE